MARPRIHSVDETFFDTIDSETKAYWLGFLYADGHPTDRTVVLGLAAVDGDHVHKFRSALKSEHSVYTREHVVSIAVCSTKLAARYAFLRSSAVIPRRFTNHFVRGVFDGDGCIHITKATAYPMLTIAGSKKLLVKIQRLCGHNGMKRVYLHKHHKSDTPTWVLNVGTIAGVCVFRDWIYRDATIYLERKRSILATVEQIAPRICEVCGKDFQPRFRTKGRYCSSECYHGVYYAENRDMKWKTNGEWNH